MNKLLKVFTGIFLILVLIIGVIYRLFFISLSINLEIENDSNFVLTTSIWSGTSISKQDDLENDIVLINEVVKFGYNNNFVVAKAWEYYPSIFGDVVGQFVFIIIKVQYDVKLDAISEDYFWDFISHHEIELASIRDFISLHSSHLRVIGYEWQYRNLSD